MRCARCDRIISRETLARDGDGHLVFGWCAECLRREGCEPVEVEPASLTVHERVSIRRKARRFIRTIRRPRPIATSRRLAAMGVSGLMAAWALVLAFVGGLKLTSPGDGMGPTLLIGSGLMAIVSLTFWIALIGRIDRRRTLLKIVQVAASIAAFGTLAWGIVHHDPRKDPLIVGVAAGALALSWAARKYERRKVVV